MVATYGERGRCITLSALPGTGSGRASLGLLACCKSFRRRTTQPIDKIGSDVSAACTRSIAVAASAKQVRGGSDSVSCALTMCHVNVMELSFV